MKSEQQPLENMWPTSPYGHADRFQHETFSSIVFMCITLHIGAAVKLQTYIREMLASILGQDTDNPI
jgi:cytochrome b561